MSCTDKKVENKEKGMKQKNMIIQNINYYKKDKDIKKINRKK